MAYSQASQRIILHYNEIILFGIGNPETGIGCSKAVSALQGFECLSAAHQRAREASQLHSTLCYSATLQLCVKVLAIGNWNWQHFHNGNISHGRARWPHRAAIPRQSASDCGHAGLVAPLLLREAPVKQSFAPFDVLAPFARAITRMPRPTRAAKRQPFPVFDVTPKLRKECSITIPPRSARPKHNQCHDFFNVFRFPNSHLKLIRSTHSPMTTPPLPEDDHMSGGFAEAERAGSIAVVEPLGAASIDLCAGDAPSAALVSRLDGQHGDSLVLRCVQQRPGYLRRVNVSRALRRAQRRLQVAQQDGASPVLSVHSWLSFLFWSSEVNFPGCKSFAGHAGRPATRREASMRDVQQQMGGGGI